MPNTTIRLCNSRINWMNNLIIKKRLFNKNYKMIKLKASYISKIMWNLLRMGINTRVY
jgi:hypothetical protein